MTDTRSEYTKGLRALATLLDANTDIPLPYHGSTTGLLWILHSDDDQKAILQSLARLFDGEVKKGYRDTDFDLHGKLAGLNLHVIADRDTVCEKIVKGTRTETVEVPDPDAPKVTVTRTVEDVEWVCAPLMAESVTA